ncbi:protein kinase [Streptomyces netropsis]|uniref:protein kinase domain-containing protein n=1 Tax=Streptomyces netropsis TaxID=55404 RepID=UPI0030D1769E
MADIVVRPRACAPSVDAGTGPGPWALDSVHTAGVVHRDLKPGNILLGADGPWVIDFGIARAAEATRLTRSGAFIGTPQFMSPEHGMGAELTPSTDVFSLGLIAAVTATGRHPYGAGSPLTVATQIANTAQRPPDLSGYPDGAAGGAGALSGRRPGGPARAGRAGGAVRAGVGARGARLRRPAARTGRPGGGRAAR